MTPEPKKPVEDKMRKVRAFNTTVVILFLGMLACLIASKDTDVGGIAIGVYVPFATGVGAALGLFMNANVKVHQAQNAGSTPEPDK